MTANYEHIIHSGMAPITQSDGVVTTSLGRGAISNLVKLPGPISQDAWDAKTYTPWIELPSRPLPDEYLPYR